MPISDERRQRGKETLKRYKQVSGANAYSAATDAIADILMFVAKTSEEATQILHAAEVDFKSELEDEDLIAEG